MISLNLVARCLASWASWALASSEFNHPDVGPHEFRYRSRISICIADSGPLTVYLRVKGLTACKASVLGTLYKALQSLGVS